MYMSPPHGRLRAHALAKNAHMRSLTCKLASLAPYMQDFGTPGAELGEFIAATMAYFKLLCVRALLHRLCH